MKKRTILSVLIIICVYFALFTLSSCHKDENPVKPVDPPPPVHPDTADRYVWKVYYPAIHPTFVYAADTDRVYMIGDGYLQLYNGLHIGVYNLNYQDFNADNVYGYDKNNVFVIGAFWISEKRYPGLKKISNGGYTDYHWNDTGAYLYDMFVTGPNQLWISALYTSKVYYFNNGIVDTYKINSTDSLLYEFFYKGKDNSFYIFAMQSSNEQNGYFYTYKFVNDHFELLNKEYYNDFPYLYRCGVDVLMRTYHSQNIKYFDGNGWVYHSTYDSLYTEIPVKIGGVSKDSLTAISNDWGRIKTYGYTSGWRDEKFMWDEPSANRLKYNVEAKFGNIYFTVWGLGNSLYIGRPNKNLKN
ncbi:MAG: hypothetical protein HY959_06435 [Ignavibacteriae bacterium]|nr:hypothetical protein [Ignavibacteriota bacterium]